MSTNQRRRSAAARVIKAPKIITGCIDALKGFVVNKPSFKSRKWFDDENT
jgi:hypothetical protein